MEVNRNVAGMAAPAGVPDAGRVDLKTYREDAAWVSVNTLRVMLREISDRMLEVEQKFVEASGPSMFKAECIAYKTKAAAIEQRYDAASTAAVGLIIGGGAVVGGAATGSQTGAAAGNGTGKVTEGIANQLAAEKTREAEKTKLLGEFQSSAAESHISAVAKSKAHIEEVFRELRETGRDLKTLSNEIHRAAAGA